jgi:phage-related protein
MAVMRASPLKPVVWLGDSLRELKAFPTAVQDEMGYAIYLAQCGQKHVSAKPLKGLGSGVLEVVSDHRGDTFRSVYTVRFADRVFVLHAFQKKSKRGIATPKADIDLLKQRLKQAIEIGKSAKKG